MMHACDAATNKWKACNLLYRKETMRRSHLTTCFLSLIVVGSISVFWVSYIGALDSALEHVINDAPMLQPSSNKSQQVLQPKKDNESFLACLLIMDDNHRLPEWLAYHYFALPLRYLVVGVDPHSRTVPTSILDQWRHKMTIVEWMNFTDSLLRHEQDSPRQKLEKYKNLQTSFYRACAAHLQEHNRTWTSFHDTDEFLTISSEVYNHSNHLVEKPGNILQVLQDLRQSTHSVEEWPYSHFQPPCISIPRALYSAIESTPEEQKENVPSFIDSDQLDTLRYRYRLTPRGGRDGLAKSVIDVSYLKPQDLNSGGTPHKPISSLCPTSPYVQYGGIPLGIHHYLGSWESYSYRDDARKGNVRNREEWEKRSVNQQGGADDEIRLWIQGFVGLVGTEDSKTLLKDAGLPSNFSRSAAEEAAWRFQGKQ